jgi:hypothetical protein
VRRLTKRAAVSLRAAVALLEPPGEPVHIAYEGTTLPGWFFEARLRNGERRGNAPHLEKGSGAPSVAPHEYFAVEVAADHFRACRCHCAPDA